jgi:D-cysteine desulfhydrase
MTRAGLDGANVRSGGGPPAPAPDEPRAGEIPLLRRFPAHAARPRARLADFPTPVERLPLPGQLWIKRDDLDAPEMGGNKVRALEFLLGGLAPGGEVLTLGGEGSTHVLATAAHARRLGLRTRAVRWRHDMSPIAHAVAAHAAALCERVVTEPGPVRGMMRAQLERVRLARGAGEAGGAGWRYIPIGGSTPLGILGHVNAGLELAEQVAAGAMPAPSHVVVPLGTGGTAAGIALGFRIAGVRAIVVGARVAPAIGSNRWRVLQLARATARLIATRTGERIPAPTARHVTVTGEAYGGAYGRPSRPGMDAAAVIRHQTGLVLDATYSAKAFAAARALAARTGSPTLFWLTFDGRWMGSG